MKRAFYFARSAAVIALQCTHLCTLEAGLTEDLIDAACEGDVEAVARTVKAGADVNARWCGATALHLAAEHGHENVVQFLLDHQRDVDALDAEGDTPLIWAAAAGSTDVARLLIARGADLERTRPVGVSSNDDDQWNPLRWAIIAGHTPMVRLLLTAGAKLGNPRLLGVAIYSGDPELVATLRNAGAPVSIEGPDAFDPVRAAAESGSIDLLRTLAKEFSSGEERQRRLLTPLHRAAENGDIAVVRVLLEEFGIDPDGTTDDSLGGAMLVHREGEKESEGFSALSRAVEGGHDEVMELLLEKGARIAGRTRSGDPLLTFVVKNGRTDLLRLFLQRRARVEAKDFDGHTALMHAARLGKMAETELLLAHNASADTRSPKGVTALSSAAIAGKTSTVALLLRHGASASKTTDQGTTVLMLAAAAGQGEICRLLVEGGAKLDATAPATGMTALHFAARGGHSDTVTTLLALGADRQPADHSRRTARDYAELAGDSESLEKLEPSPPR